MEQESRLEGDKELARELKDQVYELRAREAEVRDLVYVILSYVYPPACMIVKIATINIRKHCTSFNSIYRGAQSARLWCMRSGDRNLTLRYEFTFHFGTTEKLALFTQQ